MVKPLAPEVRAQFAQRLKEMRVEKGFPRARYFAKSLGIEENRYTRYERAEVEPSLSLIHKMCEILRVSPNELLGFAETAGSGGFGFADGEPFGGLRSGDSDPRYLDLLAWRLASEVIDIHKRGPRASYGTADDPLSVTRETGLLFQHLQRDPFGTVAEIAADEALKGLEPKRRSALAELIQAFTQATTENAQVPERLRADASNA